MKLAHQYVSTETSLKMYDTEAQVDKGQCVLDDVNSVAGTRKATNSKTGTVLTIYSTDDVIDYYSIYQWRPAKPSAHDRHARSNPYRRWRWAGSRAALASLPVQAGTLEGQVMASATKQCMAAGAGGSARFKESCEALVQSGALGGGTPGRVTCTEQCPANPPAACKQLLGQPVDVYYYWRTTDLPHGNRNGCPPSGGHWWGSRDGVTPPDSAAASPAAPGGKPPPVRRPGHC